MFDVLVVSTSAIDCLERLVSEMTYYVLSGTLKPTHSLAVADASNYLNLLQLLSWVLVDTHFMFICVPAVKVM